MIIGITGTNGSGKDTVAEYLKKKGFTHYSLSDVIRHELKKHNIEETRDNLIMMGNKMREEYGPSVLAAEVKELMIGNDKFVISSIRNPAEVEELKKMEGFMLIAVDAPIETRFKRVSSRGRFEGAANLEEFRKKEELEMSDDTNAQQIHNVIKIADLLIINDGTVEELHKKIDEVIS